MPPGREKMPPPPRSHSIACAIPSPSSLRHIAAWGFVAVVWSVQLCEMLVRATCLLLALAAVVALGHNGQQRKRHECIHDTPRIQNELRKNMVKAPHIKYRRDFHPQQSYSQIRIVTSTLDLDDSSQFCSTTGGTSPDFTGGTVTCTADDVLTAEKKSILLNNVLPAAITRLEEVLRVQPVSGNLLVPVAACGANRHTIPAAHTTSGVASADFVLYVSAGPTTGNTLAWAGSCSEDSNGRSVVGRANFGPAHISWSDTTPLTNQDQVDTAVHELIHALGFSSAGFTSLSATGSVTLREKTATVLTTTNVRAKYREFIGCDTLDGPEIEDEGGAGSAGSHFDRRVLPEELMAASGGNLLSPMTLAFLEDTGHYQPNYAAADNLTFGAGAGCGFVTSKCNTEAGGAGTWWCFEEDTTVTSCTRSRHAIGFCPVETLSGAVPTHFQYFSNPAMSGPEFFDGCPTVTAFDNRICTDGSATAESDAVLGNNFSTNSRCWDVNEVIATGYVARNSGTSRCFESQCVAGRPMFRINGSSWVNCDSDGQTIDLTVIDWKGTVTCPPAATFCALGIPTYTSTEAPPQTPAPEQESSATINANLVLSGTGWEYFFNTTKLSIILQNSIRQDIAQFLDMLLEDVQLKDLQIGSLHVTLGLLTFRWSPGGVEDEFNAAIASGGVAWMPITNALYLSSPLNNDTTALVSASTELNRAFCSDPTNPSEDFCLIVIIVIVIVLVLICCCIVACYKSFCGKDDEEERIAAGAAVSTAAVMPGSPRKPADQDTEAAKIQRLYRAKKAKKAKLCKEHEHRESRASDFV